MALTETRPETERGDAVVEERSGPTPMERLIGTGDHLSNGRVLMGFALVFLTLSAAGLAVAGLDRITDDGVLGGVSDTLWPSSIVALALTGVLPLLLGLAIHVVPRQLGSPSIAFPRAVSLALWGWLIGAVLFVTAVVLDGGIGGAEDDLSRMGNLSMGLMMAAIALGAVCVSTTVFAHRPVGMGLAKVPLFSWSMLVAGPVWVLTLGSVLAHVFLGHISRANAAGLTENFATGIAWMLRAPAVYMLCIPVLGIAGDAVAHATGRRLAPYGAFQGMIAAFGVLSFGAWAQTEAAGQTVVWVAFVVLAGLPVVAMVGGLGDAIRRGRPTVAASLGAVLLAHLLLLGAVLTAALQALDTAGSGTLFGLQVAALGDAQAIFVLAAATLGALGGLAHWSTPIFGAPVPEGPARAAMTAVLVGGGLTATVLLVEGIAAGDGRDGLPDGLVFGVAAAGALLLALGVLAGLAAALGAARQNYEDGTAPADETSGLTLEWSTPGLAVPTGSDAPAMFVRSPYPLLDLRDGGPSDEEKS